MVYISTLVVPVGEVYEASLLRSNRMVSSKGNFRRQMKERLIHANAIASSKAIDGSLCRPWARCQATAPLANAETGNE